MAKPQFKSEAELAATVVAWLKTDRWNVYQEVSYRGNLIDIVAERHGYCWCIETKLHFNFEVIEQAMRRREVAAWSSVAVPTYKLMGSRLCEYEGVGLLEVHPRGTVSLRQVPRLNRAGHKSRDTKGLTLFDTLRPEQQLQVAGSNTGGYWTPFKETCREVLAFVRTNPGAEAKAVISGVKHHWANSSAKATLLASIRKGWIPGVKLVEEGRTLRIYPMEEAP